MSEQANDRTNGLKYIAESPGREHGGFHPATVQIAKDALTYIAELTAERDKYRDACERLIGHYGDRQTWGMDMSVIPDETNRWTLDIPDNEYVPDGNGFDFARQVKAELEGIEGSEIEVVDE